MAENPFTKAERSQVPLKIGITGPSGSGKTLGALAIARELVGPDGTIAFIDTENKSASLCADRYNFEAVNLGAPYESKRYEGYMTAAHMGGYGVLVIDSLSHQWAGAGGILARKEADDQRGGNSYTNWAKYTKEHEQFKAALLASPMHIIGCMRTKQDYVLEQNSKGKQEPRKVGTAPIQRDGMEYEFSVVFDVQMDHRAKASKDRTGLFNDELVDLVGGGVGARLLAWQQMGTPLKAAEMATAAQIEQLLNLSGQSGPKTKASVEDELVKGVTAHRAVELIGILERRLEAARLRRQ